MTPTQSATDDVYALDPEIRCPYDAVHVADGERFVVLTLAETNFWLSPEQAREYAQRLEQAADQASRGPVPIHRKLHSS